MVYKNKWILGCLVLAWLLIALRAQAETLLVYGDDSYPPVVYNRLGKPAGALVEIMGRVSALTGDTYEIRLFPWKRAYEHARQGRAAVMGISKNSERLEVFDFSDPMYFDDIQIVVKKGREFPFKQLSDLKAKTFGGVLGASYGEDVDQAVKNGLFKMDQDTDQKARLHKLLLGRLDGAFIGNGKAAFDSLVDSDPALQKQRSELVVLATPLARDPLYLAIPKSMQKKDLIERFNIALREILTVTTSKLVPNDGKAKK